MRYLPVINLWDPAIHAAIDAGALRLQKGQWVRCGDSKYLSRFGSMSRRGGHVCHILAFHGPRASKQFREYYSAA